MEDKEYECPTCRGAGDWRDEEHKKHDCPDCDGEGKYVDVDDMEEDNEKNYRQPGFNNPRKYTDDLGIMGKKDKMKEGKMKGLALDMEELSDEEFEEKYQSKKSDWKEVQNKDLRMDPDQPAYIKKMKSVAGDLAAEGEEDDEIEPFSSDDYDEYGVRQSSSFNTPPEKMKKVEEEYAPSVGDLIVTGKGTKGTVESVTDEAVEFRTETGKLLRTAVSNVQPDAVNEEDFEEGNEFTQALANAKRDGKKEFEVDGKVYKVEENYAERLRTLINW